MTVTESPPPPSTQVSDILQVKLVDCVFFHQEGPIFLDEDRPKNEYPFTVLWTAPW